MTAAALTPAPPPPSLAEKTLVRAQSLGRTAFYAGSAAALWSLALPMTDVEREYGTNAMRDSYDLHVRILSRPGMREVLRKVEREDLATLPVFAATMPFDILRVLGKRRRGVRTLPVRPRDEFPYPDYYLNDFHNQANGGLSLRAALTYEWQIRFLFFGANRLMRQGVIDQIPAGEGLDVLDVGCGTASWVTQARLQDRRHRVTGVDLSPDYLRVAKLFRGRDATFLQMNGERLEAGWHDRFDVVTSIWLFHELPRAAIENVAREFARVLKPGGRLLFMDAAQPHDVPGRNVLDSAGHFFEFFNEPYFLDYQRLDLPELFTRHGLEVERTERWYASKLVVARKPR